MKILILNAGSSSLKFQLLETGKNPRMIAQGNVDGIGLKSCKFAFKSDNKNIGIKKEAKTHTDALKLALDTITKLEILKKLTEIDAIGHRVVHGGEKYTESVKIDAGVIKEIAAMEHLAPLHNPANLAGIMACKEIFPRTPQVAVFDTAFHQTMPPKAYLYALPENLYSEHGIRRYGFHGTNHKYVIEETLKLLKKKDAKIISCHLGNGSSVCAYHKGSMDTSMGFTPLEGLPMGTRCGSIDPAIPLHLQHSLKMKSTQVDHLLNEKSGLLALSEISSDMRKIYEAGEKKDPKALQAIEILAYQLAKQIGAYAAALNGVDAITFTGGIGENAFFLRTQAAAYLTFLGLQLNPKKNEANETLVSDGKSKVKVFVIPAHEDLQIAQETEKVLSSSSKATGKTTGKATSKATGKTSKKK